MTSTTKQRPTTGTFCNHCHTSAPRRDLDPHFLCAACRQIPGVTGYRDPSKRGLDAGTPDYWERTRDQLNIVADEESTPVPATTSPATSKRVVCEVWDPVREEFVETDPEPAPPGGTLRAWRRDVFAASGLESDVKLILLALAEAADWSGDTEGGNAFPSQRTLARRLGWTTWRVQSRLQRARPWVQVWAVEVPIGDTFVRTSNLYRLRWPDGRRMPLTDAKRFQR